MKAVERVIVYGVAIAATVYGLWAHGKLRRASEGNPGPSAAVASEAYLVYTGDKGPFSEVDLTRYSVEVDEEGPDDWAFVWRAWVHNPYSHWVNGDYFVELRNQNGSLLKMFGPLDATFPNATEAREANSLCRIEARLGKVVDVEKSIVRIRTKK